MTSSGNKSVASGASVDEFIDSLSDTQQSVDSRVLLDMFGRVTAKPPVMWGSAIIGYGKLKMTYASGREVEWFNIGFSPRKGKISLYVTFEADKLTEQFPGLGKYKTGKGCIYITRLSDVDLRELEKLITTAYDAEWQDPDRADGKEQTIDVESID